MSLHDPKTFARIARSLIDVQQHEGWLPESWSATLHQFVQGGSSGDPILADFHVKYYVHEPLYPRANYLPRYSVG